MNDMPDATEYEADLSRRLGAIASTTTVDAEAWEHIQNRIASDPSRSWPTRWQLVAIVVALVSLVGAISLFQKGDDSRIETVDETTTSTGHDATTTEPDRDTTTSSSTEPGDPSPESRSSSPEDSAPADGRTGSGSHEPERSSSTSPTQPGGESAGTSNTSPAPGSGGSGGTLPDGYPPAASISQPGYTVDVSAFEYDEHFYITLWRNGAEYWAESAWRNEPGRSQNCLAGAGPEHGGELGDLAWGIVRSDAARVRMVTTSGNTSYATLGSEFFPGIRAWIGERPPGQVDRFEAVNANGDVLHTATGPVWDASTDTC